jgi:hypothetical protein
MSRLSPSHPLSASSNATESRIDPPPDLGLQEVTISQTSPMHGAGLRSLRFPEKPREATRDLPLAGDPTAETWVLMDCGPDGVRPRRVRNLIASSGQKFQTRH